MWVSSMRVRYGFAGQKQGVRDFSICAHLAHWRKRNPTASQLKAKLTGLGHALAALTGTLVVAVRSGASLVDNSEIRASRLTASTLMKSGMDQLNFALQNGTVRLEPGDNVG